MAMLNRDGVNIYYEVHGPSNGDHGPAILLTHGFSSTAEMWKGQIAPLAAKHTLILWDMRGHGRTDSPDDLALYSEEATVADMAALLDTVGPKDAVIGGLSLGGYMSLAFNLTHPRRTRALLIIDTGPGFKNDAAREDWNVYARKSADRYESEGFGMSKSPERALAHHRTPLGLARAGRGMLTQRDARVIESLPGITVPSLVVVGANDTGFLKAADYMQAKIPGAVKAVIADAGHAANIDQPEQFNTTILDFLGGLGA